MDSPFPSRKHNLDVWVLCESLLKSGYRKSGWERDL